MTSDTAMTPHRKSELLKEVVDELNKCDWFEYYGDRKFTSVTIEELQWLREHCEVFVTVKEMP